MKLLVLGGQLQGTEITYLAKAAGWEVTVADKADHVLAAKLCDHFICRDLLTVDAAFYTKYDLVFPALEDLQTLLFSQKLAAQAGTPMVFDEAAYRLSRSKVRTNQFLLGLGVKIPDLLKGLSADSDNAPEAAEGYIIKPDCKSGSKGLHRFAGLAQARDYLRAHPDEGVFGQVFLSGPIYSIEVICDYGQVTPYMVTEVVIDADYDCHQIVAPAEAPPACQDEIKAIAATIGQALKMRGIFDIEFVWHDSELYVLEIDARMPSQTPIAVYHASGLNFVVETAKCFIGAAATSATQDAANSQPGGGHAELKAGWDSKCRHAILQHVKTVMTKNVAVQLIGEGQLSKSTPLTPQDGFFGADSALVSDDRGRDPSYATLIAVGSSYDQTKNKMEKIITGLSNDLRGRKRHQKTSELTVGVAVGD
ncbi:MAG: 3-methylornithine--L-lysine ligase PylC [Coriobacteriia bacterium]|nr:3-methylornithine--L-lysine ligase PylC [Coriobacteriia bacterium]